MSSQPVELDEFCPQCGNWVYYLDFDHSTGWCNSCTGLIHPAVPACSRCGGVRDDPSRTTCRTCRQEQWLEQWADELEYLIVAKGYTVAHARVMIIRMSRPLCKWCRKPIKGWNEGTLFHGRNHTNKECHSRYRMFVRLRKQGIAHDVALRRVTLDSRGTMYVGGITLKPGR